MVSSPSYDPRLMTGRLRGKMHRYLMRDPHRPLLNRSIMGQYPPGSTFKTSQGLTFLSEGIITPGTAFPCHHGFSFRGLHVGCHGHASPLSIVPAIGTSCNGFFCWAWDSATSWASTCPEKSADSSQTHSSMTRHTRAHGTD